MSVDGIYDWIQGLSNDGKNKLYIFESNARYYLGSDNGTFYDDYLLISPNTITGKNRQFSDSVSSFPSVLRNAKETFTEGKTTSFEDFPEELQLIILTTAAVGDVTSLGATRNDNDYSRITKLYNYASTPNFSIWPRIGFIFSEIIDNYNLETEKPTELTPSIIDFFNTYSNEATNVYEKDLVIKYKRTIRQQVTLQEGSSYVLKDSFGSSLSNLFSLQSFKNKVNSEIKKIIDTDGESIEATNVDKLIVDIGLTGQFYSYYDYDKNDGSLIFVEKTKFSNLDESKVDVLFKTTPYKVNINSLKNSRIYSQGTSFDDISRANQEQFYDLEHTYTKTNPSNVDTDLKLGDVYNPVEKRNVVAGFKVPEFLPFSRTEVAATGVDEVILGFYLRFIWNIEDKLGDGNLDTTIGELFDVEVKESSRYLLEKLVNLRESIIRFELLKIINDLEEGEELQDDVLEQAEKEANKNLSDLPTSELEDKQLSSEDIEKRQKLYKQCVLLLNAHDLKKQYERKLQILKAAKNPIHALNYFNGRFWMVKDPQKNNNNSILNKLLNPTGKQARPFLDMTPDIHAALQPRLRLHKVFQVESSKSVTHEIPFSSFYEKERIDNLSKSNVFDRGSGYGIKEFSFSFDGETPATAQKFIKARLSLYFQTFEDFIKERTVKFGDEEEYTFRYVDLFVNTKFCPVSGLSRQSPLYYDPSFYRLRVDVGWEPRNDKQFTEILKKRNTTPDDFNIALNATNKTFYLNLIDHTININEDGTVTIDADYIAYMQGIMGSNDFNALTTREAKKLQKEYSESYNRLLSNKDCTREQLDELAASINSINDQVSRSLHQSIIKRLLCNEALYSVTVDESDLNDYRNTDFFSSVPKLKKNISEVPDKNKAVANAKGKEQLSTAIDNSFTQDSEYQENKKIYFFFLADLMYLILDSFYDENDKIIPEVENLKPILSSFSFYNPVKQGKDKNSKPVGEVDINIGQIPIDIETFLSWYEDQIIEKDITTMPILTFIKRLLHYLIQDVFLETCINRSEQKRLVFQTTSFLATDEDPSDNNTTDPMSVISSSDPIIDVGKHYGKNLPLKSGIEFNGVKPTSEFFNYLYIFSHYISSEHKGRGNPIEDEKKGTYHLYIGADRGLTKKVSFQKSDIQYIRESRMMQQGSNGLLQLSSVYKASISMIGNTLFYPGMEVYVNPFGFGGKAFGLPNDGPGKIDKPNLSNIMGIGGYYQILRVNSKINPGSFTTEIEAHFVYSGDENQLGRDGLKKVDICKESVADIGKGEKNTKECTDTILNVQNIVLDINGNVPQEKPDNSVQKKE